MALTKIIPKIIHQIWSGISAPLPYHFNVLGDTWKRDYPDWKYEFWDNDKMNSFILEYYPQYMDIFARFPYNVQRWDAIRYLILDKIGGMYVDFDYESLKPIDLLINGKSCCFALEPDAHCQLFHKKMMFNNALMLNVPGHPFMKKIIETVFSEKALKYGVDPKEICVMNTTGPWILIDLYEGLTECEKEAVYLIPDKYVTPFSGNQAGLYRMGKLSQELEDCLEEAYAVHYFFSDWRKDKM
ncbi:glycosyltransferase family 32 protein [Dysgonomonas sp. ZJ709]|uniref:glycosyltransferase family 32 protein n=1 Tax=Dysgonomonas sp. ZJ709 TaxID=2709797 RepID=UPI0013E9DD4C|nr:glycosyltransferase [Dysgonomonas sp. ZJ709]